MVKTDGMRWILQASWFYNGSPSPSSINAELVVDLFNIKLYKKSFRTLTFVKLVI